MGTDRSRAYHGPCPCGSGEIEIEFCTPDHPWPTNSNWFEPRISCEACTAKYTFEEQGNQYGLVEKREVEERKKRYAAYKTAQADLLSSPQAKELTSRFISLINSQRSIAAIHRLLILHKLVYESYSTFLKRWSDAETWVRSHIAIHVDSLSVFLKMVGMKDKYISEGVSKLRRLWGKYERSLPFHGGPLFDTSPYR
jgi:hypothetical protein